MSRIGFLALAWALALTPSPVARAQEVEHGASPLVLAWEAAAWGPPTDRPGFPAGLRNAPIATDPATGGPT